MIKIGLLTINDYSNYGNRLQNYALQKILENLGCEVETIVQERGSLSENSNKTIAQKIKILLHISNHEKFELIKLKIEARINKSYRVSKIDNLKKFTSKYIKEAIVKISINNVPDSLANEYDYFITGSDQVWNPFFGFGNEIDFIDFAPTNKRISYAPSFGISDIPIEFREYYRNKISCMGKISVREEAGAKIIFDLTGIKAEVLVDPTILLEKEKWLSICTEDVSKPKKKYLVTYIFGVVNDKSKLFINDIAAKNNLEVVKLGSYEDKLRYSVCPEGFIDYLNSAEVIITNSFHGAVLSILLEKPFVVLDREGLNSRIDTLLDKFMFESRKFSNFKMNGDVFLIDFSHVQPILEMERDKAITYLTNALKIKNRNNL